MKQQLKETIVYKPNDQVSVTVNNKPVLDKTTGQILYQQAVTVKVDVGYRDAKLSFASEDELRQFLDEVNLEEPQQALPL